MFESNEILDRLPRHLMSLVIDQPYNSYTAQDHALWRYVMRRNVAYLSKVAHCSYVEGLEMTGVSVDRIPEMYGMNRILKKIGWAAVTVDGFIPPSAFMEFQAYKVLVIAADIRPIDQIEYTPAPDIIHEAAGHAPIIADPAYSEYLRFFGEIGSKAFSSREDYRLYEAIRHLSILKADPYTPLDEIARAEAELSECEKNMGEPSEMALIRNLHWWTVEYGLIGELHSPKIFGAGLLSSIGESYSCLQPEVLKLPYTLGAQNYGFDITTRQPQLFVTPDFQTLTEVLEQFADTMALGRGGLEGLQKAVNSGNLGTCVLSSGLQVSGVFSEVLEMEGLPVYFRTAGPTQLSVGNRELEGHSKQYHSDGFGSPVGMLKGSIIPIRNMSEPDLAAHGIVLNSAVHLVFESGVELRGRLLSYSRCEEQVVLMSFAGCRVIWQDRVLFDPAWGVYDMAVGEKVVSAYSGVADPDSYGLEYPVPKEKTHKVEHDNRSLRLFQLYQEVREIREGQSDVSGLSVVLSVVKDEYPGDWLLPLEIFEICKGGSDELKELLIESGAYLDMLSASDSEIAKLLASGLELIPDSGLQIHDSD